MKLEINLKNTVYRLNNNEYLDIFQNFWEVIPLYILQIIKFRFKV